MDLTSAAETYLLLLVKTGNQAEVAQATEEIYRRFGPALLGYLEVRFGLLSEDGEDVVQQVVSEFIIRAQTWEDGPLYPRLRRIAHCRAIDQWRRKKTRAVRSFIDGEADALPGREADPLQAAETTEEAARIQREVERGLAWLPTRERRAFRLRIGEELTYAEIAERIGCSPSTAYRLVQHAKELLGWWR